MSAATKFTKCSFCRYVVFYACRKQLQYVRPNRKLLTFPYVNGIRHVSTTSVRQVSTTSVLLRKKRQEEESESSSSSSDSDSDTGDDELHGPRTQTRKGRAAGRGKKQVKQTNSETGPKQKPHLFVTAEGKPLSREQLDEEIVKAAESVAEELKGDPGQTKIDLLSRIKYQAHMTMEQKLGKSPQQAVPIEDKSAVEDLLAGMAVDSGVKEVEKETKTPHSDQGMQEDTRSAKKKKKKKAAKEKKIAKKSDIQTDIMGDLLGMSVETDQEKKEETQKKMDVEKDSQAPYTAEGDDKTLFVKNLAATVTEDTLKDFFSPAEIDEIRLPKRSSGGSRGFGYVVFDSIETMEEQLKEKQGGELEGRQLILDYKNDKSSRVKMAKKGLGGLEGTPEPHRDEAPKLHKGKVEEPQDTQGAKKAKVKKVAKEQKTARKSDIQTDILGDLFGMSVEPDHVEKEGRRMEKEVETAPRTPYPAEGMDDLMQDLDGMFASKQPRVRKRDSETARGRQQRMDREPFTFGDWFIYNGTYNGQSLGIFTPEDLETAKEPAGENKLFDVLEDKEQQESYDFPAANAFEEQIRWTEEGKLWKFPIDNEQGWEEEVNVSFEEHIFLEDLLEDFPKKGPVRHFMELVTTALSKNPYLTVAQKHEHIDWYRNYFEEKKTVIEESLVHADELKVLEQANN